MPEWLPKAAGAALAGLAACIIAFLFFGKSDETGLAWWTLVRDPRPRYKFVFACILATVFLMVFFGVYLSS